MKEGFIFHNPGKAKILVRTTDQNPFADTSGPIWRWEDGGRGKIIDWGKLNFKGELCELLKGFIFSRLETMAPQTISSQDTPMLKALSSSKLNKLPWLETELISFLKNFPSADGYHSFIIFYNWALARRIPGFLESILLEIKDIKSFSRSPYQKIFLQQDYLSSEDEMKILRHLDESFNDKNWIALRNNVILNLGFELAPRSIQLHSLEVKDLEIFKSEYSSEVYYTLWLPMAKKIRSTTPERRPRNISKKLGEKIEALISLNRKFIDSPQALFVDPKLKKRLPAFEIVKIVTGQLKELGFAKGDGLTLLRHHLGQSLADQGASAESIAEILGHNSTFASRAYIAATPEISAIKTKALGKNETYLNIMKMLLTGEIINKSEAPKDRWVKGIVGSQYIGGIGSCGLKHHTPCPKNPVYSCYTCNKFHPFNDGAHEKVKEALQGQVQFFIDTAENAMDLENNRAVSQLELTINAVDSVINHCK